MSIALNAVNVLLAIRASARAGESLQSGADVVALLCHAIMTITGFRLVGLGEEGQDIQPQPQDLPVEDWERHVAVLPPDWLRSRAAGAYAFRYRHSQSAMTFVLKCLTMGNKVSVHGMAVEDGKLHAWTLDDVRAVVEVDRLPATLGPTSNYDAVAQLFTDALDGFIYDFKVHILHKLIPGLTKLGFEPSKTQPAVPAGTSTARAEPRPQPGLGVFPAARDPYGGGLGPLPVGPQRYPPIFDEPTSPDDPATLGRNPFTIGDFDVDPLASLTRPPHPGGGMMVGPDHPMFGGIGGIPRPGGGGNMPTFLPPGAVPPGARFDPVHPFQPPPQRPGQRPPPRPPGPGGPGGMFGGDPDNDEAPPPGYNDMFM